MDNLWLAKGRGLLSYTNYKNRPVQQGAQRGNYLKIDWEKFRSGEQWNDLPDYVNDRDAAEIMDGFYDRINKGIEKAMPEYV